MLGKVRLYDYRCFLRDSPAELEIHEGFTSFVGPNNAGKSALIRFPYEMRSVLTQLTNALSQQYWQGLLGEMSWNVAAGLYERAEIVSERNDPQCKIEIEPAFQTPMNGDAVARIQLEFQNDGSTFHCKFFNRNFVQIGGENSPALAKLEGDFLSTNDGVRFSVAPVKQFLAVLTSIQYIGPFRNAINEGAGAHFDMQVGTGFITQWNGWKTGPSRKENRAILRVTDDVRRLVGAETLDIAAAVDGKSLQVTLDSRPHKLAELGSGFAQMVLILANALVRKPSLIIIDEPELHLHPSLQTEFLTTLASYSEYGIIFATHSIGLARQAADRCFTVRRVGQESRVRPYERTPHLGEFLGSLGIAGLQELGWDTVLLVEGVKDVRTTQALLRHYGKDRRTVVVPLGGDAMANGNTADELAEVVRLAGADGKIAALVDSERDAADGEAIKARRGFAAICEQFKIAYCVTQRRALENYITQNALNEAFGAGKYSALNPYDRPSNPFWGKGETWRAAKVMTREELADTDVGQFLEKL